MSHDYNIKRVKNNLIELFVADKSAFAKTHLAMLTLTNSYIKAEKSRVFLAGPIVLRDVPDILLTFYGLNRHSLAETVLYYWSDIIKLHLSLEAINDSDSDELKLMHEKLLIELGIIKDFKHEEF